MNSMTKTLLLTILIALVATPAFALNPTTTGRIAVTPTDTAIWVSAYYTEDTNTNNTLQITWKLSSNPVWPAPQYSLPHAASPYSQKIPSLANGTEYDVKVEFFDNVTGDGVTGTNPQYAYRVIPSTMMHNSENATVGTRKWDAQGGWGIPGGVYGQFECSTCHTTNTANIMRVWTTIATPNGTYWGSTNRSKLPVNFQSRGAVLATGFGDDAGGHATSTKICEVCHIQTDYHRYNTAGQGDLTHNNNADCTSSCHKHNDGFKGAGGACNGCHGATPSVFWSVDKAGSYAGNAPGAHAKHFGLDSWYTVAYDDTNLSTGSYYRFQCQKCHETGHSAAPTPNITLESTNAPRSSGGTYSNVTNQCSTVYCHGSTLTAGSVPTPTWAVGGVTCGACHGATSATPPTAGSHERHAKSGTYGASKQGLGLACTECHGTSAGATNHVRGNVEWWLTTGGARFGSSATYRGAAWGSTGAEAPSTSYGQCNNIYCHSSVQSNPPGGSVSYTAITWGTTTTCSSCHVDQTATWSGSHQQHMAYPFTCGNCHDAAGSEATKHADRNIDVKILAWGSGVYNGTPAPGDAYNTCTSVYCHSTGTGSYIATPRWGSMNTGNCGTCHGVNNTTPPSSDPHPKHVATASSYMYSCSKCHSSVVSATASSAVVPTITDMNLHVNNAKNVAFDSVNPSGWYSVGGPKSCGSMYCHGSGKPQWTAGALACSACHQANNALPGNHSVHYESATVATDRWATILSSGTQYRYNCGMCHDPNGTSHAGGEAVTNVRAGEVDFDATYVWGSYAGAGTTWSTDSAGYRWTAGAASNACSNIYCHSQGRSTGYAAPNVTSFQWASTSKLDCTGCHGYKSGTVIINEGHNKHVSGSSIDCSRCHSQTVPLNISTISDKTRHVNKTRDVAFDSVNPSGWYSVGGPKSCGSMYCHGSGKPQWTGAALQCNSCHSASNALAGNHSVHYESASVVTERWASNASSATQYIFQCGMCHDPNGTSHAGGEAVTGVRAGEVDFDATYVWGSYTGAGTTWSTDNGFKWTAGAASNACQNIYCHSQGTAVAQSYLTPVVNTFQWVSTSKLDCSGCHGSGGDNTGRPAYANWTPKANSHSRHMPWNTTTLCSACHYATVTGIGTIADKTKHVNKAYDLAGYNGATRQWASLYNFSYAFNGTGGTCNNANCHGGQSPQWGTPLKNALSPGGWDCISCHSYGFPKRLGSAGTIRQVVARAGTNGDFKMTTVANWAGGTRHLYAATTIVKWDCIVCHREGYAQGIGTGRVNWGYHNDGGGLIHLRNVDTVNEAIGWAINNQSWTTNDYADMDNFCLSCHDTNGANVWVNASNNGIGTGWGTIGNSATLRSMRPFNTTDVTNSSLRGSSEVTAASEGRGAPRDRVIDVKTQFYPGTGGSGSTYNGNPSQHAVIGGRYSQKNSRWNTSSGIAWTSVILKKMSTILNKVGEMAVLSCADCHILDAGGGAHGGAYMYNLWGSGAATNMTVTVSNNVVCWRCHNSQVYNGTATAPEVSRIDHSNLCNDNPFADNNGSRFGNTCQLCHAGWWYTGNGMVTIGYRQSYGAIHGTWGTYSGNGGSVGTIGKYRFFPGTHMMGYRPGGGNGGWASGFGAVSWTCYFPNSGDRGEGFNNCQQHNAGTDTSRIGTQPPYGRPLTY